MFCPEAKLAGESDFTPDQMEFIQQLYSQGVIPSKISDIISKLVGKEFNSTTISNIERKQREQLMRHMVLTQKWHLYKNTWTT